MGELAGVCFSRKYIHTVEVCLLERGIRALLSFRVEVEVLDQITMNYLPAIFRPQGRTHVEDGLAGSTLPTAGGAPIQAIPNPMVKKKTPTLAFPPDIIQFTHHQKKKTQHTTKPPKYNIAPRPHPKPECKMPNCNPNKSQRPPDTSTLPKPPPPCLKPCPPRRNSTGE